MSKNLTRKGLAVGASFALVLSALTALPAQAAVGIELTGKDGKTAYGMISGVDYTFTANGNSEFPVGNAGQLRVQITNVDGGAISGLAINGVAVDGEYADDTPDASNDNGNLIVTAAGSTKSSTDGSLGTTAGDKAVFGLGESRDALGANSTSLMTSPFLVKFTATAAADAPKRFDVAVFADSNNNAVLDAGETVSATRTVTFTHPDDIEPVVTITAPTEGDTAVSGSFVLPGIAMDQLTAARFGGYFTYGDDSVLHASEGLDTAAAFDTDKTKLEVSVSGLSTALAKNKLLKLQALYVASGSPGATDKLGTAGTTPITARKAASFGAGATGTVNIDNTALATGTLDIDTRTNSSFAITVEARDNATFGATGAKAVAGAPVTVTVTSASLSTTKKLTVNGTTYTSSSALPGQGSVAKLALTTNASGQALVNLTTEGYSAGDDVITLSIQVENFTAQTVTIDAEDPTYTITTVDGSAVKATTSGSSVSVPLQVYDQFGGVPADKYDLRAIVSSSSRTGTDSASNTANSNVALVGGKATLSIADNGKGLGTNGFNIGLYERLAGNTYGSLVNSALAYTVHFVEAAGLVVGSVDIGTHTLTDGVYVVSGTEPLNLNTPAAFDTRSVLGTTPSFTTNSEVTIAGVTKTAGTLTAQAAVVPGATVTVSGAGMQFKAGDRWAVGSITVVSNGSGVWSIDVASNKSGDNTVTVTSGGVTETVKFTVAAAASNTASSIKVSAPKSIKSGRTLVVTVTLTDKFGNPVKSDLTTNTPMTVTYDGPGFVTSDIPQVSDANGQLRFRVILGVGDSGPAIVSVNYAGVDRVAFASEVAADKADNVTGSSATWVGPIANAKAGAKKGRVIVEAYRAKGKTVSVFVGSTRVASFVADKVNDSMVVRGIKSGTRNVSVRLSGPGEDFRGAITVK